MVNIKHILGLSLILGVLKASATGAATCKFEVNSDGRVDKADNCDDGYYLLNIKDVLTTAEPEPEADPAKREDEVLKDVTPKTVTNDEGDTIVIIENKSLKVNYNPTPGYYVNGAAKGIYISCNSKGICKIIAAPNNECSKTEIGKLVKNGDSFGVCLGFPSFNDRINHNYYTPVFASKGSSENYLVPYNNTGSNDGNVFKFDKDFTFYALKITENSITFDRNYSTEKDQCVLKSDGKVVNRLKDFCSNDSTGKYYTCTNGKCESRWQDDYNVKLEIVADSDKCKLSYNSGTKTCTASNCDATGNGYHIVDKVDGSTGLFEYTHGAPPAIKEISNDEIEDGFYWNDYQYNNIISCTSKQCKKVNTYDYVPSATAICNKNNIGKLMDTGYNIVYCYDENVEKSIDVLTSILVKGSSVAGNPFNDEDYKYEVEKKDEYSLILSPVNCDDGKCSEENIIENSKCRIKISSTDGRKQVSVNSNCKSIYNIETDNMPDEGETVKFESGYAFVKNNGRLILLDDISTNGNLIKCEANKNVVTCSVISWSEGYYINPLSNKGSFPLIKCDASADCWFNAPDNGDYYINNTNKIVNCQADNSGESTTIVCTESNSVGYLKIGETSLRCGANTAGIVECKILTPITINDSCSCTSVGSICKSTNDLKICTLKSSSSASARRRRDGEAEYEAIEYSCNIGDLYIDSNGTKLCINGGTSYNDLVDINNNPNANKYFLPGYLLDEDLTDQEFYLVSIENGKVTIDKNTYSIKTYKYSEKNQIEGSNTCSNPSLSSEFNANEGLMEYVVNKNDYVYSLVEDKKE